jgi:hypothetical protein
MEPAYGRADLPSTPLGDSNCNRAEARALMQFDLGL